MCHNFELTSDNSDFVPLFFPHSFILQLYYLQLFHFWLYNLQLREQKDNKKPQ